MNFLQLVNTVALRTEVPQVKTLVNPSKDTQRLMDYVNDGYNTLVLSLYPRNEDAQGEQLITTIANQNYIACPFVQLNSLAFMNGEQVKLMNWSDFEIQKDDDLATLERNETPVDESRVSLRMTASVYARTIHFYPTPVEALTLKARGNKYWGPLILDTDEPITPLEQRSAIVNFAVYKMMLFQGDPTSQSHKEDGLALLELVKRHHMAGRTQPCAVRLPLDDDYYSECC